jgi:hypothetical protein
MTEQQYYGYRAMRAAGAPAWLALQMARKYAGWQWTVVRAEPGRPHRANRRNGPAPRAWGGWPNIRVWVKPTPGWQKKHRLMDFHYMW